jgi:glycosyltransferase involved in cell wall biosynthesis
MAIEDFLSWGIRREKLAFLPYSTPDLPGKAAPDPACASWKGAGHHSFIYVGSLYRRKGVDLLLKAFSGLRNSKGWRLILVGDDRTGGAYGREAEGLGILDRVLFRGVVRFAEMPSVLAAGDVFVLPSRQDGWGVALNEAATLGLALVGSDRAGASHHMIRPGVNGFVVQGGSMSSLAAAMQVYVDRPELVAVHGARSREIVREFSAGANAERLLQILDSWLSRPCQGHPPSGTGAVL